MEKKLINIGIYSEDNSASLVESALRQLELPNSKLNISFNEKFVNKKSDLSIVKITNRESKLLDQIINQREQFGNQLVFIIEGNDRLLAPILAKLGFNDIFLFPDELFKFNAFISEQIEFIPSKRTLDYSAYTIESLIGTGKNSAEKINISKKTATNPGINLLIYGETGTGKGLLANTIHNYGDKNNAPFIEVICTAIPDSLLESELFGYERGAFTDAKNTKVGLFELAENGTLFLDEIGDLNLGLQAKLLKVIEKKVFKRLGGIIDIPLKARIISASNKDLLKMVENKLFRRDLYYRLSVVNIELLSLRDRKEEIIPQAENYISRFTKEYNKNIKKIDKEIFEFMYNYSWPGNLREFRNTIEMSIVMLEDDKLTLNYFKNFIQKIPSEIQTDSDEENLSANEIKLVFDYEKTDLSTMNKMYAKHILEKCNFNKSNAAKILKISRPKLDNLLS